MKIGILTHHYIKNYGAFLQTYALQETLKKEFPNDDIYIINFINRKHKFINICGWFRYNLKKDTIKTYFEKIKIPIIFSKIEKEYLNTTKKVYTADEINKMNFDTIVIGSDEVWHYDDKKAYNPIKFAFNLACKNIITYAPSVGGVNLNKIPKEVEEGMKKIKKFSARDDGAEKLVKKIVNQKCTRVLDPTLLYEFPEYKSSLVEQMKKEKYVLMYYCDNLPNDKKQAIIKFAKENHYKIYGAGEYQKWFDSFPININPFEWVEMFKNAEYIFTGTFHGTIFSIKSKKQFVNYLSNKSRIKKVKSLLDEFHISERSISNNIKDIKNINYEKIYKCIETKKNKSIEYLITGVKND